MPRPVRLAVATALGGVALALPPAAAAEPARFAHGTIDQTLTTTKPGAPTGFHFVGTYHAAGDPDSPPPYMRAMTFYDPTGSHFDTSVPERCTASDYELATAGAAACPEGSRLGGGTTDVLFMGTFPNTVEIDVFNNAGEQIMVARSPLLATVTRGRIRPDGRVEYASPTCYPSYAGCPVDNVLQLRSKITVPPYVRSVDGRRRSYRTTPPKCPKSRRWEPIIRLWWADGTEDAVTIRQRCKPPKPKRRARAG